MSAKKRYEVRGAKSMPKHAEFYAFEETRYQTDDLEAAKAHKRGLEWIYDTETKTDFRFA